MPGMMKVTKVTELNLETFSRSLELQLGAIWPENFKEIKFYEVPTAGGAIRYTALIIWKVDM